MQELGVVTETELSDLIRELTRKGLLEICSPDLPLKSLAPFLRGSQLERKHEIDVPQQIMTGN